MISFKEYITEALSPYALRLKAILDKIGNIRVKNANNIKVTDMSGNKPEIGTTGKSFRIEFDVPEESMDDVFKIREAVRRAFNNGFNGVNGKEDSASGTCYSIVKLIDKECKFFFKSPAVAKGIEFELAFQSAFESAIKKKLQTIHDKEEQIEDPDSKVNNDETSYEKDVESDIILDIVLTDKDGTSIKFEDVKECRSVGTKNTQGSADKVPSRIDFKIYHKGEKPTNISLKNSDYLFVDGIGGNRINVTGLEKFFLDNFGSGKQIKAEDFNDEKIWARVTGQLKKLYDTEGKFSSRNTFFGDCDYVIVINKRLYNDTSKPDNGVLKGEDKRITVYYKVEKIYSRNSKIPKLFANIMNAKNFFFGKVGLSDKQKKAFGIRVEGKTEIRNVKGSVIRGKD